MLKISNFIKILIPPVTCPGYYLHLKRTFNNSYILHLHWIAVSKRTVKILKVSNKSVRKSWLTAHSLRDSVHRCAEKLLKIYKKKSEIQFFFSKVADLH